MEKVKRKRFGRRILSFVLSLVLTLGLLPEMPGVKLVVQAAEGITITIDTGASVTIKDADGDGYYDIGTADELYAFAAAVNSGNREIYGELTADIVVNESLEEETRKWMPIGNATYPFKGKFDGNGHTISGLYFKDARVDYVGLFGYVQSWSAAKVELRNIGIINSMFLGDDYVGAICGIIDNGLIHNCYNTGEVLGRYYVGGICGYSSNSAYGSIDEIKYCYSSFGGVSGYDDAYIYKNCYYIGNSETDNISGTEYKTEANFKSGEVCWLLNDSTASDTSAWGQNIGIDSLPILGGPVVYSHTFNGKTFYSNGKNAAIKVGDVYEIDSADKLRWFLDAVNSGWNNINAKLTADIDLTGCAWNCMETYAGTFDGNGYTIKGMCTNSGMGDGNRYGLIRTLSSGGKVTNLTISNATLWSNKLGTGSIAETNEGVISNCLVKKSTLQYGAGKTLGGIAGTNAGTITNCGIVECSLKRRWGGAGNNTLGYVADVNNGTVSNCYSYGCTLKDASVGYAIVASGNSPTNCYYYTTSTVADTAATQKTKEQFASGEVCYLLNGSTSTGDLTWGQILGTNSYPLFKTENDLVCKNPTEEVYSNHNQFNANGFCSTCGAGYEKPEIIGGVYRIENVGQLLWFAEFVNSGNQSANAKLTADINMNGIDWTMMSSFSGTFDGAGHTISGLNGHKAYDDNKHGFIRTLVNGGAVKNLTFNEASVFNNQEGSGSISAVIAYTNNGTIENCVVKNSLIQSAQTTLAVVAGENNGTIRNSASISNEVKRRYSSKYEKAASGFVWSNGTNATIESCMVYDCAYVEASANYAFTQSNTGTITNCYYYESSENLSHTVGTPVTAGKFASGEVAYLLNGSKTTGTLAWYQNLDESADAYPVLDTTHSKVYGVYKYDCPLDTEGQLIGFNNNAEEESRAQDHTFENNKCVFCGLNLGGTITIAPVNGGALTEAECEFANGVHTIKTDRAVIISGITTTETVVVASGVNANITLNGVTIDVSSTNKACAFKIEDNSTGNVTITLADGTKNILKSGERRAGLQKNGEYISDTQGKLTIQGGTKGTGKLTATGGYYGAGIGGNNGGAGTNITISGGTVTATGGYYGAGIGGGYYGSGTNITISGGVVEAIGGYDGAGIGGGYDGSGTNITISGGTVTATGGDYGAGIGGGYAVDGINIIISGGTVTATGGDYGAGIGGGYRGVGSGITISGGTVTATGGDYGAGIGGGDREVGSGITISGGSVNAIAGNNANAIGGGRDQSATTPTLADKTTPVYLFEIDNAKSTNIVINDKDYPDAHGTEKKIYAYLPAKSVAEPNVIQVGNEVIGFYYDTDASEWKQPTIHTHEDNDKDGHCDTCNKLWVPAVDSNGDGVYEIGNANQLYWFAEYVNAGNKAANAELTADIDFSEWDFSTDRWIPICQTISFHENGAAVTDTGYTGIFDGNGYTITGLTVTGKSGATYSYGLFGTVSGTIKNLGMVNFVYTMGNAGDTRAGSVAGQLLNGGSITDCYSIGHSINTSNNIAGGIAGCNYGGTVSNCYALNGTVTGYGDGNGDRWGGVVGDCQDDGGADAGRVTNCYTDATHVVSIQNTEANITDCYVKEDAVFASGEMAYLLNGSTSGGTTWYQTLSGNSADTYPVLNSTSGTVYYGYNACKLVYTNDNTGLTEKIGEHSWTDGTCTVCEKECSHSWNGDTCTICGFQYVKDITIKLADGTAFGEGEYTFDHDTKVHTISTTKNVTISGTTTKETIVVAKNVSANITLAGVTIDVSDTDNACALEIEGDGTGTVTITLADQTTNTLNSGYFCAGLQIEKVSGYENKRKLIIDGTGALDATSGGNGAGIGGGFQGDAGSITINGGTIEATGGSGGAGIGGGYSGTGGSITINGGTIEATGGSDGAGIGGGDYGAGGSITINGGNVKTVGTNTVPVKGTLQNDAGEPLYLHTITLNGITEKTAITAIAADAEYGLKDVKTLDTNKLYVYLPFASMPYEVDAGGNCYYGKLTGDVEKKGTFYKVSFEKNSDTEMTGTGEEISTVISIAVPSDNKYTGAAIEAVVTDNYNENAQGMVQYEALEGMLTPVVVTMAPAPTPTPEPQVSFAPEPSVEPSSTPEVTDEPSGSSAPSGPSTPVRLSAALPATSWEPAPAPTEIPVSKNMPVNKGTYKASITLDGETIFVTYDIVARTLQASDFKFTAPEGAVYDGNTHQAAVESALEGMGEITIAYYDEAGNPVNGIPVDAGTYTVKISVSEGENCNAAECLTDDSWTFTIEKKAITITAEDKSVCVNCEEPAFTYVVDGLVEDDVLLAEPVMDSNADMVVTGNYAITPSAADAGSNYSITYVPGTLTVTEHLNDVDDFKCDVCGAIVDGVDLRGSNLTLNGNIGLNLFFEIDEEVKAEILADETAIIRFNLPDGSVTEVPAKEGVEDTTAVVGTTLYKYPCELTAKQMTDKVKVQFVTDGNIIAEYEYSIADYAAVIIANAEGKYSAESIALVKAMLNYGAYAQKNFGYNAENLANAQLAENEKSLSSVTVGTFETSKASGMIVDGLGTFAGSSLVLKSETTLKVYFEPAEGVTAEDLTFTVDGEEVTATTSGKYLVISITDIKAQELDKVFAVKVTDGNKEGTFNACVFAYCYSVLSDTTGMFSEELKDVVKALYLYNVAADAYFN